MTIPLQTTLTAADIDNLAPCRWIANLGKMHAKRQRWVRLEHRSSAIWGEIRDSFWTYRVAVDELSPNWHCSCQPLFSPCRHALALLYLAADSPELFAYAEMPEWVSTWIEAVRTPLSLRSAAATDATKPGPATHPPETACPAQDQRVDEGLKMFALWLEDLVRVGLCRLGDNAGKHFEDRIARLVDADAPGLAAWLRRTAKDIGCDEEWPARVLAELGRMSLLLDAWRDRDRLPPGLQMDIRSRIGLNPDESQHDDSEWDCWEVVAQTVDDGYADDLHSSWLWGMLSGRAAFELRHHGDEQSLEVGEAGTGRLAFCRSACPQRGRFVKPPEVTPSIPPDFAGALSVDVMLEEYAEDLAALPWLERQLFCLKDATVLWQGNSFLIATVDGKAVPLAGEDLWELLAVTGGTPADGGGGTGY